jgi:hypothetical protein
MVRARKKAAALADAIEAAARTAAEEHAARSGSETARGETRRGRGPTEQLRLDRVPVRCTLDKPDRACPNCGAGLKPMEGQFETSELIDVVDIKYVVSEGPAAEVRLHVRLCAYPRPGTPSSRKRSACRTSVKPAGRRSQASDYESHCT